MTLAIDEAEAFHRVKIRALGIVAPHGIVPMPCQVFPALPGSMGKEGEAKKMTLLERRLRRRQLLRAGAAAAGALLLPGRAPAQGGAKPLSGTTLNIACWSSPYAKLLTDFVPQFEEATGAKVNYETPSFPIYNQRVDVELSTGGSSYDVLNVTFIYIGRWIGAGWFVPLDPYLKDPQKTSADWEPGDFLPRILPARTLCLRHSSSCRLRYWQRGILVCSYSP